MKLDENEEVNCFGGRYFGCHWAKSKQACEIYKQDGLAAGVPVPRALMFNCDDDFVTLYGDKKEAKRRSHWCSRFKYFGHFPNNCTKTVILGKVAVFTKSGEKVNSKRLIWFKYISMGSCMPIE